MIRPKVPHDLIRGSVEPEVQLVGFPVLRKASHFGHEPTKDTKSWLLLAPPAIGGVRPLLSDCV
nr:MAG TPA: hypothetical protein [Caudoviricetes sp.]